jgi:hypothetical protein
VCYTRFVRRILHAVLRVDVTTPFVTHAIASYCFFPIWLAYTEWGQWGSLIGSLALFWVLAPILAPLAAVGYAREISTHSPLVTIALMSAYLLPLGICCARVRAHRMRWDRAAANLCASCGYDLRATPDRCPECGAAPTARDAG